LSTYCDVKVFRQPYVSGLKFIGARADVEWATWLLEYLADFIFDKLTDQSHPPGCRAAIRTGGGAASISGFCYNKITTIGTTDLGGRSPPPVPCDRISTAIKR
jgi:hypothetical protein